VPGKDERPVRPGHLGHPQEGAFPGKGQGGHPAPVLHQGKGRFLFASEIKAIFMDPAVPREIDPESLYQVFTFWTTLSPRTVFKDIYELPPGHTMTVRDGADHPKPVLDLPVYAPEDRWKGSFEEAKEELKAF
jgi:asparagine synthase (glutamine-hydrolysing)